MTAGFVNIQDSTCSSASDLGNESSQTITANETKADRPDILGRWIGDVHASVFLKNIHSGPFQKGQAPEVLPWRWNQDRSAAAKL